MNLNRRDFLRTAAVGATAVGLAASATSGFAAEKPAVGQSDAAGTAPRPAFHSRHIPIEILNLETPTGKDVVRNGLCDTIKPDILKKLRDLGVELIETRFSWWEIEPEAGRFNWSRALRDIDAILDAGLKVGIFAWFHYPPAWYDPEGKAHARLRALGNNREATVLSLWDPKTLDAYDRLLRISAEKLKGRVSFVYNAISGNYGEVTYELGAKHYRFSSPGSGSDCFLGDRCARASFAKELQQKYGNIDALNRAWGVAAKSFDDDLMPKMPFAKNPLRQRDDCMLWATHTLIDFADAVCALYQKHFPGIPGALPIGFVQEDMVIGQIKSQAAKLAAKYGLTSRWTGCAYLNAFERSNFLARRVASAAHFYGSPFGTEAALIVDADNAANALYEGLASGAALIHDDPQNMLRSVEVQTNLRPKLVVDPPETSIALFYPVESNMLELDEFSWKKFVDRSAELRRLADFDVCDSTMIADGYLKGRRELFFPTSAHLREDTAEAITDFAASGGRVWLYGKTEVGILHQSTTLADVAAKRGQTLKGVDQIGATGLYRFDDWRQAMAHVTHAKFAIPDEGQPCYRTLHHAHESCYFPKQQRCEIRARSDRA